jgi:hypothetical protein
METAPLHVAADSISDKMKAVHTFDHKMPSKPAGRLEHLFLFC